MLGRTGVENLLCQVPTRKYKELQKIYGFHKKIEILVGRDNQNAIGILKKSLKSYGGVYCLIYKKTNQIYIGKAINLHKRPFVHRFKKTNEKLHRLLQKYGASEFYFGLLWIAPNNVEQLVHNLENVYPTFFHVYRKGCR